MEFKFEPITVLLVIGAAIFSTSFCQFVTWYFVYRKQDYKVLKNEIQKLNKKVEKKKNMHVIQTQNKSHQKKLNSVETQLKTLNQEMTTKNMKSTFGLGIFMLLFINFVGSSFQGIIVAKLPFTPFSLIQGLSHRNIEGTDFTDCSYLFIYIIFAYIWRTNLKKIFGFQPPKAAVSFFDPPKMN